MRIFLTSVTLALAIIPATADSQGVDYQPFRAAPDDFVLGSSRRAASVLGAEHPGQESGTKALASDFQSLGSDPRAPLLAVSPPAGAKLPRSRIPAWMRSGSGASPGTIESSHAAFEARFVSANNENWRSIPAGCQHSAYRPKGLKREMEDRRARYYPLVITAACQVGVPAELFDALITQESGYNPYALSAKGAMGMAQLMPATARSAGVVHPWDIEENLRGGARILKTHLAEFGRYDLALAAYNAGAGRVRSTGRVPRIRETAAYVSSILTDVRRQYVRAIGFAGASAQRVPLARTASLVRF